MTIYEVYPSVDGITQERRPVVYSNGGYLYFVGPGKCGPLNWCRAWEVYDPSDSKTKRELQNLINSYQPLSMYERGMNKKTWTPHLFLSEPLENINEWRGFAKDIYNQTLRKWKDYELLAELRDAEERFEKAKQECIKKGLLPWEEPTK